MTPPTNNTSDCQSKETREETFHCLQTEATEDIQKTQGILTENQGAIKQTLDIMNDRLNGLSHLFEKQMERSNKQDTKFDKVNETFQEIRDFIVKKDTANGYMEKEIHESKDDIKNGHDNRLAIETRVSTLEACYDNLKDSNQTIINLLKAIGVGLIIAVVGFICSVMAHII